MSFTFEINNMLNNNISMIYKSNLSNYFQSYEMLKDASLYYPDFYNWYFLKVVDGLRSGDRKIVYYNLNYNIAGLAILKYSEKKICTLKVLDGYKNKGIGIRLFEKSFEDLKTEKPFFTVSEEKYHDFRKIFDYFGFIKTDEKIGLYREGKKEYFYNQGF